MTIAQALKRYSDVENELLLGHVLRQSREFLYLNPAKVLTARQKQVYIGLCQKRRRGMPAAYLLGYKYFCGLRFQVNQKVLIPRPESEWLVEQAIAACKRVRTKKIILDIGTGSGALIVGIAKSLGPKHRYYASDISAVALKVARRNARLHQVKILFKASDLFRKLPGSYDLILANLPYVPGEDYKHLKPNLRFEPKSALVGPGGDFRIYQRLLAEAASRVKKGSIILLETDPKAISPIKSWAKSYLPDNHLEVIPDLQRLPRYVRIIIS